MATAIVRAERLRQILAYDPTSSSGLRWKVDRGRNGVGAKAGSEAAGILSQRCRGSKPPKYVLQTLGMSIAAHIAVWEIVTGSPVPKGYLVRHKDGNTLNNRIENLELYRRPSRSTDIDDLNMSEIFSYDPLSPSGLVWKVDWTGRATKGSGAGSKWKGSADGKVRWAVRLLGRVIGAHRIIWQLECGAIPDGMEIDHIDGNPLNNVLSNLRVVTTSLNCRNRSKRADNRTGVVGVYCDEAQQSYRGQYIDLDGKQRSKRFSIRKHGRSVAFKMATQWRADRIAEINAGGAGYTARHIGDAVGRLL